MTESRIESNTTKVEATLKSINEIVAQISPLASITIATARAVIGLLKARGEDTTTFEAEIAKFEAANSRFGASIAAFQAEFGGGAGSTGTNG